MAETFPIAKIDADWLYRPQTQAVLAVLEDAGFDARVVGGAVRNSLLGRQVADIDIATTALPEQVIAVAKGAGLTVVPTGLKHGTVTVIADALPHEVTTLRRDVETDGRHAVIAFSDDWAEDAGRRDFTINALYCDRRGVVHDPLGGLVDLAERRVRFIGDAQERIKEDYLRILRFFRFSAEYALGPLDAVGLAAAGALRRGLLGLSAERVRAELLKLLVAVRATEVVRVMTDHGFLSPLLGHVTFFRPFERGVEIEAKLGRRPDAILRLGLLAVAVPEDARDLAVRLRLSAAERRDLKWAAAEFARGANPDAVVARAEIYRLGRRTFEIKVLVRAARVDEATARKLLGIFEVVTDWAVPVLPIGGRDLMAIGIEPGLRMGETLRRIEAAWIASDFRAERAELLALAHG